MMSILTSSACITPSQPNAWNQAPPAPQAPYAPLYGEPSAHK